MKRLAVLALAAFLGACGTSASRAAAGPIVATGFAYSPPTQGEAAAYLTLTNRGAVPDTVLEIGSPLAGGAMVHRQVEEGGAVRMEHVEALAIPAGDSVRMAPGGLHIMLTSLAALPQPGDSIPLVVRLAHAGELKVTIPVRAYGEEP